MCHVIEAKSSLSANQASQASQLNQANQLSDSNKRVIPPAKLWHLNFGRYPVEIIYAGRLTKELGDRVIRHRHSFPEIHLITRGHCLMHVGRNTYHLKSGDGFYLQGQEVHELEYLEDTEKYIITFNFSEILEPEFIDDTPEYAEFWRLLICNNIQFRADEAFARSTAAVCDAFPKSIYRNELSSVLQFIIQMLRKNETEHRYRKTHVMRIHQSIAILKSKMMGQRVTLGELASAARMSKRTYCRVFPKVMGTTPHRFLCDMRTNEARKMIGDGELKREAIAYKLGYRDRSGLYRLLSRLPNANATIASAATTGAETAMAS